MKWLVRAAAVVLIYTLAGFFLVPAIIKWQMLKRLPALTHRAVAIKQVRFNPYALSLAIRGFALTEPDGSVFSSFDELYVNFQLSSIFRWKWTFAEISLKKPFAQVTFREDGTFNFANLLPQPSDAPASKAPPSPKGPPAEPPPLLVFQLSITNGTVAFADQHRAVPFQTQFTPIDLHLTNLTTLRARHSPYSFIARTGEGEVFAWAGRVTVNPPGSAGTFRLAGLKLPKYAPYARDFARFQIADGLIDVTADYQYDSQTNALDLVVSNAVVHLNGLELKASDTGERVLAIPGLTIEDAEASVARQTARVGKVTSSGGFVLVRRKTDGSINLLSELAAPAKPADAAPNKAAANTNSAPPMAMPPWKARIDDIAFENYSINAEDQQPAAPASFKIDRLAFHLKGVSNESNAPVTAALSLRFQGTGAISASGKATLMPPGADVDLSVSNLDLRPAQPYAQAVAKFVLVSGAVDVHGHARYAPPEPGAPILSYTGDAAVNRFEATDDVLFKDFAKWDKLSVEGIRLALQPDSLHADEILFAGLETSLVIGPDKRPNLQTILRKENAATNVVQVGDAPIAGMNRAGAGAGIAAAGGPGRMQLPDISVGTLAFEKCAIHFMDQSLEPRCSFTVGEFGGTIEGISSRPGTTATVDLRGNVDARSPFSVTGKVNPLSEELFADIAVTFTNTELTPFTPYTEKFAGRPLQKGKLSFAVHYAVKGKSLEAENAFNVDQLTLGAKNDNPDATKLPVKLAIALLKDRSGRIHLDVPLHGRIDDPKFSVVPLVWQVVMNLIEKAALSPFSLLGAAFGGGEEMSQVAFEPGQPAFAEGETNKLEKLAKALYERPEVTLEIQGGVDPAPDRERLARTKFDEQVRAAWLREQSDSAKTNTRIEDVKLDQKTYERMVRKIYRKDIGAYRATEPASDRTTNATGATASATPAKSSKATTNIGDAAATGLPEHGATMLLAGSKPANGPPLARRAAGKSASANGSRSAAAGETGAKELSPREAELADMEDQLTKRIDVGDDDLRDLMQARANKVQAYLLQTGKVTVERLFIIAPKPINPTAKGQCAATMSLD